MISFLNVPGAWLHLVLRLTCGRGFCGVTQERSAMIAMEVATLLTHISFPFSTGHQLMYYKYMSPYP